MSELAFRLGKIEDRKYWYDWLNDPAILPWFPMSLSKAEIEDSLNIWCEYIPKESIFTVEIHNEPVGVCILYLPVFEKLRHHSILALVVSPKYRKKKVGTRLMEYVMEIAKKKLKLEQLHLEVYDGNPAIRLYERLGFKRYGLEKKFTKEDGSYIDKIMMYRFL